MRSMVVFAAAAACEIAGCFAVWSWARSGASSWWLAPGILSLIAFAGLLTLATAPFAGRAFAAYGGVYIVASLAWLWAVEGTTPDRWDVAGAVLCLIGAMVTIAGPRAA